MLHEIADLSSHEDSLTMNTDGHRRNLATGTSPRLASAFVYGAAANHLCGCDSGTLVNQLTSGVSFTTMVLTLWTLALGAYIPQASTQDVALRQSGGGQDPEVGGLDAVHSSEDQWKSLEPSNVATIARS